MKKWLTPLGILLLLGLWTAVAFIVGEYTVPLPWTTVADTVVLLSQSHIWLQILITLGRIAAGFSLAFVLGTLLGLLIGSRPVLEALFRPGIHVLQGTPPLLWSVPLVLIMGIGHLSPIVVIMLICLPLIVVNVSEGVRSVPQQLAEMLQLFAPRAKLRALIFPHLYPFFVVALKLGLVLGVKASVVAEYFTSNSGIGFQINAAYQSLQIRRVFSWGLLLILLILLAGQLLNRLHRNRRKQINRSFRGRSLNLERLKENFLAENDNRVIRIERVGFGFKQPLLININLTVHPREIVVISGDSGTGKTTLLYLIASLLVPNNGRVERPETLGMVFQDDRFLPWFSNLKNVALPLLYGGQTAADAYEFAAYLMAEAGLETKGFPDQLSGGMKKRLAFARCFARFPDIILLDEPFSGLHRDARRELWEKLFALLDLHRVPAVIVTHFPEEVPPAEHCSFYVLEQVDGGATLSTDTQFSPPKG